MLSEMMILKAEEFREWMGRDDDGQNQSSREDRVG